MAAEPHVDNSPTKQSDMGKETPFSILKPDIGELVATEKLSHIEAERRALLQSTSSMSDAEKRLTRQAQLRIEAMLPITWISEPAAHEKALTAEADLKKEAKSILETKPNEPVIDAPGLTWTILSASENTDPLMPKGTDLVIKRRIEIGVEHLDAFENIHYVNDASYFLTPQGVILIERNIANKIGGKSEVRSPKRPSIIKKEVDEVEIEEIIQTLRGGKVFYEQELESTTDQAERVA